MESDRPRDDEIQAFHNQIRAADAEKLEFVGEKVSDRVRIALECWFQIFWKVDHQLKCVFGHWSRLYSGYGGCICIIEMASCLTSEIGKRVKTLPMQTIGMWYFKSSLLI